jgi:hypothetical protein
LDERDGRDVSPSGWATPMMYSSSPSFIAAAVEPTPRTTVSVLPRPPRPGSSRRCGVTWTMKCSAKYAPLSTTIDVADVVAPPVVVASNRASEVSSSQLYFGSPSRSLPAARESRVSGFDSGSSR